MNPHSERFKCLLQLTKIMYNLLYKTTSIVYSYKICYCKVISLFTIPPGKEDKLRPEVLIIDQQFAGTGGNGWQRKRYS